MLGLWWFMQKNFDCRKGLWPNRRTGRMALHHPNQVGIEWGLELVLGGLVDTIDQASTSGTAEDGLVSRLIESDSRETTPSHPG